MYYCYTDSEFQKRKTAEIQIELILPTDQLDTTELVFDYDTILAQDIGYYLSFYRKNKLGGFFRSKFTNSIISPKFCSW